jgi:diguanylate cyclase (GGDEF)-like protein
MPSFFNRLAVALLTDDRKRSVRLKLWLMTVLVYVASGLLIAIGVYYGLIDGLMMLVLGVVICLGLATFYVLLRTGWSERFKDKALTQAQIAFSTFAVLGGYSTCGAVRSTILCCLLFIFMFGAFSLGRRQLIELAVIALGGLAFTIALLHRGESGLDLRVDIANFLAMAVLLPSCAWLTAQLSELRGNLHRQRSDLATALSEVERLATRDELTGLINRRAMQEVMNKELVRSERNGLPFCVVVIDLDHFKRVNDVHGHAAGDTVLQGFAVEAQKVIRGLDTLARWGGEEFLLIMSETTAPLGYTVVERMRERLEDHVFDLGSAMLKVTMSAGIAEHVAGESLTDTINRADEEVYRAKAQGRNVVAAGKPRVTE